MEDEALKALIARHTPPLRKRLEGQLKTRLLALATKYRSRFWVNTVGLFYNRVGTPIRCGLHASSSDLIGYRVDIITQDMVGQKFARFCAVEVKKPGLDTTDPEHLRRQQAWIAGVVADGGVGGIVRSEEELISLLEDRNRSL